LARADFDAQMAWVFPFYGALLRHVAGLGERLEFASEDLADDCSESHGHECVFDCERMAAIDPRMGGNKQKTRSGGWYNP